MEEHQHGERGEAAEFRNLVTRYPKLTFRVLVAFCLLSASGGGYWLRSAYGQFQATVKEVEHVKAQHVDIVRNVNEQREDIREIRSDVKEILRSQRRSSALVIPERREAVVPPACGDGKPARLASFGAWDCSLNR